MKTQPELLAALRAIEAEPWRADLVRDYSDCAARWGQSLNRRYHGDDFEPPVMNGLYLAAGTWDPGGRSNFLSWLRWKVRSSTIAIFRRRGRHRRGLLSTSNVPRDVKGWQRPQSPSIRLRHLVPEAIEGRFYYRPDHDYE